LAIVAVDGADDKLNVGRTTGDKECEEAITVCGKPEREVNNSLKEEATLICGVGPWALNHNLKSALGQFEESGARKEGNRKKVEFSKGNDFSFENFISTGFH
jgi:hypothetical protein